MAKYDVTFSCGHEQTVQLFGPEKERQRKIRWMEDSGLCSACRREKYRSEQKAKGFTARVAAPCEEGHSGPVYRLMDAPPFADGPLTMDGETPWAVVFDGDTYGHKDDVKALGARWVELGTVDNVAYKLGASPESKRWVLFFDPKDGERTVEACEAVGASFTEAGRHVAVRMGRLASLMATGLGVREAARELDSGKGPENGPGEAR